MDIKQYYSQTMVLHYSKRDIAADNFVMHEVHCHRNIQLCKHCEEPVPRSEMDDHYEQYHAKIECPKCKTSMAKSEQEHHQVSLT